MNKRFLLVDDDTDDASLFREALAMKVPGSECHTVEDGIEMFDFLAKHESDKPDVIFLDINMPVMNGWECLRKLKNNNLYMKVPTVMYSTSSAKRDIEKAYGLGVDLFVTKPEDFLELAGILEIIASSPREAFLNRLRGFESVKIN